MSSNAEDRARSQEASRAEYEATFCPCGKLWANVCEPCVKQAQELDLTPEAYKAGKWALLYAGRTG